MQLPREDLDVRPKRARLRAQRNYTKLARALVALKASLVCFAWGLSAHAIQESNPIHFSGDKQVWDRNTNQVELFGHATVNQPGETIMADYILLNQESRVLTAQGNCVYIASESVIWGEAMYFNLDTRTGHVVAGRVSNDKFTLRGEELHKLGPGRFKVKWGDYTTCIDCSASWSFLAEDVDMELGGYAYFSNVTTRIKGAPTLWFPYLILPMKTQRQSGLLFPKFTFSGANGATFMLPYFWAIDRSADMTFSVGTFTRRGLRVGWEGRYVLSPDSSGLATAYVMTDRTFPYAATRWSLNLEQKQTLPYGISEKLQISETSDNPYIFLFPGDLPGKMGEAFLPSSLTFEKSVSGMSSYLSFQRYRNLLNSTPGDLTAQNLGFDGKTVQVFPKALVTTNDRFLGSTPFVGGLSIGVSNFTRSGGSFDYDDVNVPFGSVVPSPAPAFSPGVDPIRKALRFEVTPSIYTTFRLWDAVSIVPQVQYKAYFYQFGPLVSPLSRSYLHFKTDISTQIERVFEYPDDPDVPRVKHLIRPMLSYSLIPVILQDDAHPFVAQIERSLDRGTAGYFFDNHDIVPYTFTQNGQNYFVPQGHSITYGFTSQWIQRQGGLDSLRPSYRNIVELSSGQSVNFIELSQPRDPSRPRVFTRFFTQLQLDLDRLRSQTTYYYYPEIPAHTPRHTISTGLTYTLESTVHQYVMSFQRSFSLNYNYSQVNAQTSNLQGNLVYSISDYLMPTFSISYDFITKRLFETTLGMTVQSASRCWRVNTALQYRIETREIAFAFDWELNLTGSGYGTIGQLAETATSGLSGG